VCEQDRFEDAGRSNFRNCQCKLDGGRFQVPRVEQPQRSRKGPSAWILETVEVQSMAKREKKDEGNSITAWCHPRKAILKGSHMISTACNTIPAQRETASGRANSQCW